MFLKVLTLTSFKNYDEARIDLSNRVNCFVGNNGVGKTNILDAVHYLSLTKSFFNNVDGVNIKHNADFFIINGVFCSGDDEEVINCSFQRQKQKSVKHDGKVYQRLSEHIGRYPVVMLSPADSNLIFDGGEERRKFMNLIVSQYDNTYLPILYNYNKALQQRNKLLKSYSSGVPFDKDSLLVWDMQLIRYGEQIYGVRKALVDELIPLFSSYYKLISLEKEDVSLSYRSQLHDAAYGELLSKSLEKDKFLEYTTVGVHKDDLVLEMDGYPVKSIASQGQQKSYLTALKLAKYEYIRQKCGVQPILLFDDIFDKFDTTRVEQIIKIVMNKGFGQIFVTDTNKERLKEILSKQDADYKMFDISDNEIHVIE